MDQRLAPFHVHDATYKVIGSTPIQASILIPKSLKPGKHPLLVRWHGGYLICGARLDPDLLYQWALDFAVKHAAIYVIPDYRLIPESTGLDILEDVADFWAWVLNDLPGLVKQLAPGHQLDLSSIAVVGESAGGYLSIQSALLHPEVELKAVIAAYPVLDAAGTFFSTAQPRPMFGIPVQPESVITEYIASLATGSIKTSARGDEQDKLAIAIIQNGWYFKLLGEDDRLQPYKNLERQKSTLPFIWTYHGRQDTGVPVEGTEIWEKLLNASPAAVRWKVTYEDGEHGFDSSADLETPWLKEGLLEVEKYWP